MSKNLISSIKFEFGGRTIHLLTSGLLLILLTRILGPEGYGLFALAISVLTASRIFSEFGIPWSAGTYITQFRDESKDRAATVVVESGMILLLTAAITSLLVLSLSGVIASILSEPAISTLLAVGAGIVFFSTVHTFNRHVLQGYDDVRSSAVVHSLQGILTVVFVSGLVIYDPSPLSAIVGYTLAYAVAVVAGVVVVGKVATLTEFVSTGRSEIRKKVARYSVPLAVTRLSEVVDGQVDVLLVGYFVNPTGVAFYALGKQISRSVQAPAQSIGFALSPTYGARKATGDLETATAIFEESLSKTLILYVPASAGIFVIADPAVPVVFGDSYTGAIPIVQILSLFVFFVSLIAISDYAIDYLGRARSQAILKGVTSIGNVVLNLILIPVLGVTGAAIATVITTGAYATGSMYILYTELPFGTRRVTATLLRTLSVTVVMAAVVYATTYYLTGIVAVGVGIAVGIAVWTVGCHALELLDFRRVAVRLSG